MTPAPVPDWNEDTAMKKLSTAWKNYAKSTKGNVALMLALASVPVFAAAGAALDFGRYVAVESELSAALDSASLAAAAASGKTDAERQAIAVNAFNANIQGGAATDLTTKASFTIQNGTVTGEAHANMTTALMNIVGVNNMDVVARNAVGVPDSGKAEIAFVLDYSGSMADQAGGQVKYIAMGQAANKLIDSVSKDPTKVKIGLVPFSQHVYGTLQSQYVKGASGSTWTGCTQDQMYPYNLSGDAPNPGIDASKWGQPMVAHPWKWSCADYASHNLIMRPLTNDFAGLKAQISASTPYQNTHIALGAEFGYQMLSPTGAFSGAAAYSDKQTKKFMVLLTDGMQTEPAFGPGGSRTVSQGDTNLELLCSNIKANGITIITIAYDLNDGSQQQRLKNCASDPAKDFFVANSGADVSAAFDAITQEVNQVVYLSK
jgi:Flp pilus assembly protein TadG